MKLLLCYTDIDRDEYTEDFEKYFNHDASAVASFLRQQSSEFQKTSQELTVIGEVSSLKLKEYLFKYAKQDNEFRDFIKNVKPGRLTYKLIEGIRFYVPDTPQAKYLLSKAINSNPKLKEYWDLCEVLGGNKTCLIYAEV